MSVSSSIITRDDVIYRYRESYGHRCWQCVLSHWKSKWFSFTAVSGLGWTACSSTTLIFKDHQQLASPSSIIWAFADKDFCPWVTHGQRPNIAPYRGTPDIVIGKYASISDGVTDSLFDEPLAWWRPANIGKQFGMNLYEATYESQVWNDVPIYGMCAWVWNAWKSF